MAKDFWTGRAALVTGGAGFIGSNIAEALLVRGARVRILDDFSTGRRSNLEGLDVEILEGSIVDPGMCRRACEGVNVVFHEAALPSVARSVDDPAATHAAGATGTLNILNAARLSLVDRVVYAASSSAYGDTPTLPKHEAMPTSPRSPYAVSKLTGEMYVAAFANVYDFSAVALRYFNVFGPRQDPKSQYGAVIPVFCKAALDGRSPRIDGDGQQTRDFTYIDNAVSANLKAAEAPRDRVDGRVFNVGAGDRTSVLDLWTIIKELTEARVDAVHAEPRAGDVRDSLADIEAARAAFGYEVLVGVRDGLARTIEYLRDAEVPVGA